MQLKLEHFALNVADPVAAAAWYEKYIGLTVVRWIKDAHNTFFLADYSGKIMIEIYNNPPDKVPAYATMDPLLVHLGFISEDPEADKKTLLSAGATLVDEKYLDDGSHLIMMRDPWGLAIQLCHRANAMINRL